MSSTGRGCQYPHDFVLKTQWLIFPSVIHRADYHGVLLNETVRLGGKVRTNAEVVNINYDTVRPEVVLHTGETITADVVVGADGKVTHHPFLVGSS